MGAHAVITEFDAEGKICASSQVFLPEYLDRRDVRAKIAWFLMRGFGNPKSTHLLLDSQGDKRLAPVTSPLRNMMYTELKGIDDGLQERLEGYCRSEGIPLGPLHTGQ